MKRWLTFHRAAAQVQQRKPSIDKSSFARALASRFDLQLGRKVYYADDFAVRFCCSATPSFSGTVISLKVDLQEARAFLNTLLREG